MGKKEKLGVFYKSYDIKWLREMPEHPDYKLVAEYDALVAKAAKKKGKK